MFGKLPANSLMQFPNGKWGFVGTVDLRLGYLFDGQVLITEEEQGEALRVHRLECSMGLAPSKRRISKRTYPSREVAIWTAQTLRLKVTE